jgi:hypothetical protein
MYFVIAHRHQVIAAMSALNKVCGIGVLRGDNAHFIANTHNPQELYLIDRWQAPDPEREYYITGSKLPFMLPPDAPNVANYFGGDPLAQSTYDNIYNTVKERFSAMPNVKIMRMEGHLAADEFPNEYFDLIYIDANHMYPYVQRDAFCWKDKVKKDGFIILNDCSSSPEGSQQNLGVLEAATNFIKMTDFKPLVLTHHTYADLVLTRMPQSGRALALKQALHTATNIFTIELPNELLFSFHHRLMHYYHDQQNTEKNLISFAVNTDQIVL